MTREEYLKLIDYTKEFLSGPFLSFVYKQSETNPKFSIYKGIKFNCLTVLAYLGTVKQLNIDSPKTQTLMAQIIGTFTDIIAIDTAGQHFNLIKEFQFIDSNNIVILVNPKILDKWTLKPTTAY